MSNKAWLSALSAVIMLMLLSGCQNPNESTDELIVTVTIVPQQFFVKELGKDQFQVNIMIPPGTGHANYDPAPQQITALAKSSGYLKLGYLGFEEAWLPRLIENHPDLPVFELSKGIQPITAAETAHVHDEDDPDHHHHEGVDPHIWMSPKSAVTIARETANALIRIDPACEQMIRKNLDSLETRIQRLDQAFTERTRNIESKSFIIFHPALTYLARDYGLEQIPMELGGKEPSAAHLKELVDQAISKNIKTIFVQKEYDIENAEVLSREIGAEVIQIDPLSPDWETEMWKILEHLTHESN